MSPARILVVEDQLLVSHDLVRRLEAMSHEVVGAADCGAEAVAIARRERPDVVLMDGKLRGEMSGFEAARQIRDELGIPIVFLTALAGSPGLDALVPDPALVIAKPFAPTALRDALARALELESGRR